MHHLGNIYAKELDEKALTYYDAALAIQPESFEVMRNKGLYLKDMENYKDAKVCFENIIATDDHCEECYFNIGNIYIAAFRDDMTEFSKDTTMNRALEYFQKAIELNDQYVDAFYNTGLIYEHKGNRKKAIEFYQKALVIEPMHEPSMDALRSF